MILTDEIKAERIYDLRVIQTYIICCVKLSRVGKNLTQRKTQPVTEFSILLYFTQSVWMSL